jgi:DNA-binding NarL/FixJ family response regulator
MSTAPKPSADQHAPAPPTPARIEGAPAVDETSDRTFGQRRRDAETLAEVLSPRQREVLAHLLRGDSVKQIAATLHLSQHTVNEYIKDLHRHFNVSSRGELLALFIPTFF